MASRRLEADVFLQVTIKLKLTAPVTPKRGSNGLIKQRWNSSSKHYPRSGYGTKKVGSALIFGMARDENKSEK